MHRVTISDCIPFSIVLLPFTLKPVLGSRFPEGASTAVELIHGFHVVCLSAAMTHARYRSASIVTNISCSGIEVPCTEQSQPVQLDLECNLDMSSGESVWMPSVSGGTELSLVSPAIRCYTGHFSARKLCFLHQSTAESVACKV